MLHVVLGDQRRIVCERLGFEMAPVLVPLRFERVVVVALQLDTAVVADSVVGVEAGFESG